MHIRICTRIRMYILVTWLRVRSKEKLCVHMPCSTSQWYSTGHQTGFIVRINCVRIRQEISRHISIAYNIIVLDCAYLQYILSIIHHTRIQIISYILPRCAAEDKVQTDHLGFRPWYIQLALYHCCSTPREDITITYI